MFRLLAILPLAAIAYYVYALHTGLDGRGPWVQWKTRDISSLLTGQGGALVDRAFYRCGAGLILAGFVLSGMTWPAALYAIGGAGLIGAALSRAIWPNQNAHIGCSLAAFAGVTTGNVMISLHHHWLSLVLASFLPVVIGIVRACDDKESHVCEWLAAGAVLAVAAVLLLLQLFGLG